ncbi:replication restart helicase PriA [Candidatus Nitrospira bockiana]
MPDETGRSTSCAPPGPSDQSSRPSPRYADVVLPRHLYRVFTYRIPEPLRPHIAIGSVVVVPFGRTTLRGTVVATEDTPPLPEGPRHAIRFRDIAAVDPAGGDDRLSGSLLALTRAVAEYYLAPWGQCIRLVLPPVAERPVQRYRLTEAGRALIQKPDQPGRMGALPEAARILLTRLGRRAGGLTTATLRRAGGSMTVRHLHRLERHGLIESTCDAPSRRTRAASKPTSVTAAALPAEAPPAITETRLDNIERALETGRFARFLLWAPRSLRRASIQRLAESLIKRDRAVLIIAPEIARAETFAVSAKAQWGDRVEWLHSGLSTHERRTSWERIRSGAANLVIGTRSAVFAPLPAPALIVLDDEEDASLKEESEPRYHARTVASMRAQAEGAVLLLGSGHPTVETWHAVHEQPQALVSAAASAPHIETVDLRRRPYGTLLSDEMVEGIRRARASGSTAVLYLNRKGFAPALVCRDCGNTPQCPQCRVALTFYKQAGRLVCHSCHLRQPLPDTCPTCSAPRLEPSGIGTEAIEERVRRLFPDAVIARLDRDVSPRRGRPGLIVPSRPVDIVIGTQLLFQASLPNTSFVGVVYADAGLHMPDFRASEQTYHALAEAVGLVSAGDGAGHVVMQTRLPAHHVIAAVSQNKPAIFYDQELAFRRALAYPPFGHLFSVRVSGASSGRAQEAAEWCARRLSTSTEGTGLTVWGPTPPPHPQLRGKSRWQLLVKTPDADAGRQALGRILREWEGRTGRSGLKLEVDVDPLSIV